jgi:hypothetical protein
MPFEEYLVALRQEATQRVRVVSQVLADSSDARRAFLVNTLKGRWLGTIDVSLLQKNLEVLAEFLGDSKRFLMDLMINPGKSTPIAEVAGRPADSGRPMKSLSYPGLAGELVGEGRAPGMSFNPTKLKPGDAKNWEYRIWTMLHESTHAILGTYDYAYYAFQTLLADEKNAMGPTQLFVKKGPRSDAFTSANFQRNADSWSAFMAQAWMHIAAAHGTSIMAGTVSSSSSSSSSSSEGTPVTAPLATGSSPITGGSALRTCSQCDSKIPLFGKRTICPLCEEAFRATAVPREVDVEDDDEKLPVIPLPQKAGKAPRRCSGCGFRLSGPVCSLCKKPAR